MWFLFAEIILSWWYSWQSHPIIIGNALERMICIICAFGFWNILFIVPERLVSVGMFDTGSDYRLLEYSRMTCSSICNTFFVPLFASSSFFSSPFHFFFFFFFIFLSSSLYGALAEYWREGEQNPKSLIGRKLRQWLLQHRIAPQRTFAPNQPPEELYSPNSGPAQLRWLRICLMQRNVNLEH